MDCLVSYVAWVRAVPEDALADEVRAAADVRDVVGAVRRRSDGNGHKRACSSSLRLARGRALAQTRVVGAREAQKEGCQDDRCGSRSVARRAYRYFIGSSAWLLVGAPSRSLADGHGPRSEAGPNAHVARVESDGHRTLHPVNRLGKSPDAHAVDVCERSHRTGHSHRSEAITRSRTRTK